MWGTLLTDWPSLPFWQEFPQIILNPSYTELLPFPQTFILNSHLGALVQAVSLAGMCFPFFVRWNGALSLLPTSPFPDLPFFRVLSALSQSSWSTLTVLGTERREGLVFPAWRQARCRLSVSIFNTYTV